MTELTETDMRAQLLEAELKLESSQSEFNKQRSKFKDILLTQESELKLQQDKIDSLSSDNMAYHEQLAITNKEHSEAIEMLKLSQTLDEQDFAKRRSSMEQEQNSLRQSYHLQLQEYQAQLQVLSMQKVKWVNERDSLIQELSKQKTTLDSMNTAKQSTAITPTLEDEMSRAQEESSKLKNVVIPLEREIANLKKQLEQSKRNSPQSSHKQYNLINFDTSETDQPVRKESDAFLSTILSSSDIEASSNINAFDPLFESSSIGVVQQILDISQGSSERDTKRESQDRMRGLEGEVRDCQLRCTKYEGLLDELRADNYELTDKCASLTAHLSRIIKEMNMLKTTTKKLKDLLTISQVSLSDRPDDFSQLDWDIIQEYLKDPLSPSPITPTSDRFSMLTGSPVRFSLQTPDSRQLCTTPELNTKLVELTDEKGISLIREELAKAKSKLEEVERENKSLKGEVDTLQQASRTPGNIETSQTQKQMTFLKVTVDQQKSSLVKERRLRTEMRKEIGQHLSNIKSIEEIYSEKERALEELTTEMREELSIAKRDAQQQIAALMNDREKLLLRIKQLEDDYSSLGDQRQGELKSYSAQLNEEKYRKSEAENNVAALQQQLVVVQEAKTKQHSEFGSKLTDRADQITKLQSDKEQVEDTLAEEVTNLTKQVDQLRTQLEIIQTTKAELLSENHRLETELTASVKKYEHDNVKLTDTNNLLTTELESKVALLEEKEAAFILLKTELNTSEEVQRDFVRLSQRLQKQVAELEDDKSVLRWEFEEDVLQCRNCNQPFNMTRRKHRCRHCCSLFCHECSQWTAENLQNKEARVCEVCYKLLGSSIPDISKKKRPSTSGDSAKSN
ncbi:Rab GTPase-binding effector protein 1-like [Oopsacas minuta]|uniref:Rab GTPase-binding effector protein 1-like n=1 Tax=Oopsacas minuta TaxID=111878 RepID=A0AAV7JV51_9METZ|nr:Rab GTPase-binding effector protein 1-like [Oopsacas minuta]